MTTTSIPALLEPIQERLEVITPGPWTDWDRGIGHEIHDQYGEPINSGHRETFSARDADFIANAPTDTARLLAAVKAVERIAKNLDELADGDRHYANLFRSAVEATLRDEA